MTTTQRRDELSELIASTTGSDPENDGTADEATEETTSAPFIILRTGSRWFAIRAEYVSEVVTNESISRVPQQPPYVLGVSLVHGRLVAILDLPVLVPEATIDDRGLVRSRLVILNSGTTELGVTADEVRGVVELPDAEHWSRVDQTRFLQGEIRWNKHLVCLLDGPSLAAAATGVSEAQ